MQALSAIITNLLAEPQLATSTHCFELVWQALKTSIQGGGATIQDLLRTDNAALSQKVLYHFVN